MLYAYTHWPVAVCSCANACCMPFLLLLLHLRIPILNTLYQDKTQDSRQYIHVRFSLSLFFHFGFYCISKSWDLYDFVSRLLYEFQWYEIIVHRARSNFSFKNQPGIHETQQPRHDGSETYKPIELTHTYPNFKYGCYAFIGSICFVCCVKILKTTRIMLSYLQIHQMNRHQTKKQKKKKKWNADDDVCKLNVLIHTQNKITHKWFMYRIQTFHIQKIHQAIMNLELLYSDTRSIPNTNCALKCLSSSFFSGISWTEYLEKIVLKIKRHNMSGWWRWLIKQAKNRTDEKRNRGNFSSMTIMRRKMERKSWCASVCLRRYGRKGRSRTFFPEKWNRRS